MYIEIRTSDKELETDFWKLNEPAHSVEGCSIVGKLEKAGTSHESIIYAGVSNPGFFPAVAMVVCKILDNHHRLKEKLSKSGTRTRLKVAKGDEHIAHEAAKILADYQEQNDSDYVDDDDDDDPAELDSEVNE